MKILFVTHRYPPRTGGVETHVREIATRLADRGHEVTVFSADAGDDLPSRTIDDGARVRRFHSISPDGSFYLAPQMAVAVCRADADVVHAHNYHAFPLFFAAVGANDERFVVTTHYHGESANGFRDVLLSCYRPLGRWAVQQAEEVIAVSEWERDQLQVDFDIDATVIPNGVDIKRFKSADAEVRHKPYLLCVGRVEEYKGIQHVVRALSELSEYDLVIAGSGPYRKELERIAQEEGVVNRVHFLGYVADEQLPNLYAGADAYVTMSEFESYGITVAEALAAGSPCVVRDSGGLQDWADRDGVVVTNRVNAESIREACLTATEQHIEAGTGHSWDVIAKYVLAQYYD